MTIDTRGLHADKIYTKEERDKLEPQLDKLTNRDIKKLAKFINRDIGNAVTAYLRGVYLNESKEKNGKHLIDDLISKLPEDKISILEKKGFIKNGKLKHPEIGSNQVAVIQSVLGVEVDGKYGPKTFKAVIEFQKSHGLKIDAIVGEETLKAMIKDLGGEEKKDNKVDNNGKKVSKQKENVSKAGGNTIPGTVDISGKSKEVDKKEDDSKAKTDNKTTKPNYQLDSDKVCKTDKADYNGKTGDKKVEAAKGKEDKEGKEVMGNADRLLDLEKNTIKSLEKKYDVKIRKEHDDLLNKDVYKVYSKIDNKEIVVGIYYKLEDIDKFLDEKNIYEVKGVYYFNKKDYNKCIENFEQALKYAKSPEDKMEIYDFLVQANLKLKNYDKAISNVNNILLLTKDPNKQADLYLLIVKIYIIKGEKENAIATLESVLNIDGISNEKKQKINVIIKKFKNKEQTKEIAEQAIKDVSKIVGQVIKVAPGMPNMIGGSESSKTTEKKETSDKEGNKEKQERVETLHLQNRYDVKIEKTNEGMYLVYDKEGKFLRNFDDINKIDEGISKALLDKYEQLGDSLKLDGKIYEAISAYGTALEYVKADKDKIGLNAIIGDLYYGQGDYKYAIGAYEEALKLSPNNEDIKKQLAESYVKLGAGYVKSKQYENAKYAYKQALKYVKDENEKKKIEGYISKVELAETAAKAYEESTKDKKQ